MNEDDPTVCVKHYRFLPCRREAPDDICWITSDPRSVAAVDAYQRNYSMTFASAHWSATALEIDFT